MITRLGIQTGRDVTMTFIFMYLFYLNNCNYAEVGKLYLYLPSLYICRENHVKAGIIFVSF